MRYLRKMVNLIVLEALHKRYLYGVAVITIFFNTSQK